MIRMVFNGQKVKSAVITLFAHLILFDYADKEILNFYKLLFVVLARSADSNIIETIAT
jgi:hypothetical protein